MCGIAGYLGDFDAALLARMNAIQAHRGPDDEGIWVDQGQRVGLAHRRLSIIDVSAEASQPMRDPDHRAVITYNGEIYNYRELRAELSREGIIFRSQSDTEVLLHLYLRYGRDCLRRLNGIYAFAIWDMAKKELFVARDPFGVKPLYYTQTRKGFLFASELKALLCEESVDRAINARAVWNHIHYLWSPAPDTMLRRVFKALPGETLRVRDRGLIREQAPAGPMVEGLGNHAGTMNPSEVVERVRHTVREAVRRQMVADVPVGSFLSGGLDSSAIVAFAREFTPNRLQCFTIELLQKDDQTEDLPYARRVARHLDVDLHVISVGAEISRHLERVLWHLDEPQADPAPVNALLISELARAHGIKVLLSGAGGDDIFGGYRRHYALLQERRWNWLPRWTRSCLRRVSQWTPRHSTWGRQAAKAFAYADGTPDERLIGYFHWIHPLTGSALLHPDLLTELGSGPEPLIQTLHSLPPHASPLNKMLALDVRHFLGDHNLNYGDKMSMAVGVETRVPLLDPDLVRLAFALPDTMKQHGRTGKWVFKQAMEGILPQDVIYRPKTGFSAPLRRWMRHEWRELVDDTLSPETMSRRGLFNPVKVADVIKADRDGIVDAAYPLFALLCMELWCRRFLDGQMER